MPGKYIEIEKEENTIFRYSCKYNEGVGCHPNKHHCNTCGWNPAVARERLLKICFDMGIDIPESVLEVCK